MTIKIGDIVKNINGIDLKFDYEKSLAKSNKSYFANLKLHKIY